MGFLLYQLSKQGEGRPAEIHDSFPPHSHLIRTAEFCFCIGDGLSWELTCDDSQSIGSFEVW